MRSLADLLRSYGVDAEIDQYAEEERQDWKAFGDGTAPADQNRGVQAEMTVIRDFLQRDRPTWTKKILPVVLPGGTIDELPDFVGPYALSNYRVEDLTLDGIDILLHILTSQPRVRRPPLGKLPNMSHQAMGELVAELVDLGHLERVPDPTDGRARLIRPTAQGLRALDRAGTILRGIHEQWQNRIDPLRIEQILDALTTLVDVCDTHLRETRSLAPTDRSHDRRIRHC